MFWVNLAWVARHGRQPVRDLLAMTRIDFERFRLGIIAVLKDQQSHVPSPGSGDGE